MKLKEKLYLVSLYQRLIRRWEKYPYYEEKVYYIKIREGLYLYSVIEYAMCRLLKNQGGGELLEIVNTARTQYIGRTFGLDAQENAGHDIVGAPGCLWISRMRWKDSLARSMMF